MIICGLKLTHDAAVAIIEDGVLRFSVELEKIANNPRYSEMGDLCKVADILESGGLSMSDVDRFVVDGWHGRGPHWRGDPVLLQRSSGRDARIEVAAYNEENLHNSIVARSSFPLALPVAGDSYDYVSYMHVAGHVLGAYCASPYAPRGESAYVLVWDGGQYPRLYFVDADSGSVANKGHLFLFLGTIYGIMGHYFGPYKRTEAQLSADRKQQDLEGYFGGYSIAGKLMSYIALGNVVPELLAELPAIHRRELEISNAFEHRFARALRDHVVGRGYSDADVLLTQHTYLQNLLLAGLEEKLARDGSSSPRRLCFTGGSALNIKWNSAIRRSGLFEEVWVPPFPNDSGSALGAACCELWNQHAPATLHWSVYSGPTLQMGQNLTGWHERGCTLAELAELLATEGEPVVFLNGPAELGPRALGNRSILAPATDPNMKSVLNRIKKREEFRPVAPICMQEYAEEIFDPGTCDPYMLFDHIVREHWRTRVPAICHLDGTARLQTVSATENRPVYELLEAYRRLTGIPLLSNTSANRSGCGFFPDVGSALRWGGTNYVYCSETLYQKHERQPLC